MPFDSYIVNWSAICDGNLRMQSNSIFVSKFPVAHARAQNKHYGVHKHTGVSHPCWLVAAHKHAKRNENNHGMHCTVTRMKTFCALTLELKWKMAFNYTWPRSEHVNFVFTTQCPRQPRQFLLSLPLSSPTKNTIAMLSMDRKLKFKNFEAYSVLARPEMSSEFCCIAAVGRCIFVSPIHTQLLRFECRRKMSKYLSVFTRLFARCVCIVHNEWLKIRRTHQQQIDTQSISQTHTRSRTHSHANEPRSPRTYTHARVRTPSHGRYVKTHMSPAYTYA